MTDDFRLFSDSGLAQDGTDDDATDADTALVSAYLARELTLVQIVAVEERLATDQAFRAHAAPIIAAWTLPRSYGHVATKELAGRAALATVAPSNSQFIGRRSLLRVAAIVALFSLPAAGLAQAVSYVASHPDLPGHEIARRIVAPFRRDAQSTPVRMLVPDLTISGERNDIMAAPSFAVAPNGNVIVMGPGEYRGKVFAPDGKLIRTFARGGQGPGEFYARQGPRHAGMVGDTLWVFDRGRIALFTSDGRHIRDVPFGPTPNTWQAGHPEYLGTTTGLTLERLLPGGIALAIPGLNGGLAKPTTTPPLLSLTWEGKIIGTPIKLPLENLFFNIPQVRSFHQVFAHMPKYALSTDGRRLVIAKVRDGTRPYVELLHLATTGDTIATHRVPFTPDAIPRRSVDSVIANWSAPMMPAGRGRPPGYQPPSLARHERALRDSLIVPRYFSPFSGVMLANDGTTWLRWHVPGNDRRWLVVSPRGEVLMQVEQPRSSGILKIDGAIWGVTVDSDGFLNLIRFAVREGR